MQKFEQKTANAEKAVPLSDALFGYLFTLTSSKAVKLHAVGRTIAFLLLYMTFFVALTLVALVNTAVITAETAFFTLIPLSVAAVILLLCILSSSRTVR